MLFYHVHPAGGKLTGCFVIVRIAIIQFALCSTNCELVGGVGLSSAEHVQAFLCWMDYCNQLTSTCQPVSNHNHLRTSASGCRQYNYVTAARTSACMKVVGMIEER